MSNEQGVKGKNSPLITHHSPLITHHSSPITHYYFMKLPTPYSLLKPNKGQSLVEILIAIAIGSIMIAAAAAVISVSLKINAQAGRNQTGTALAKELLENVRVWGEKDWHNIANLATSSANGYFLIPSSSSLAVASGTESVVAGTVSGLVGHWKMDEASGTLAYDSSGNYNNGTLVGGPTRTASSSCRVEKCIDFDGTDDYINASSSTGLDFTSAYTISMWVYPGTFATYRNFITRGNGNSDDIEFYQQTSGMMIIAHNRTNGGSFTYENTPSPTLNTWTHIAITYDSSRASGPDNRWKIYYNNVLQSGSNPSGNGEIPLAANTRWQIGQTEHSAFGSTKIYKGKMDDVRIYNRALSADEIEDIYSGSVYSRYFYLDDVGRDGSGNILASGGTNDPSTKKVTVSWSVPQVAATTLVGYITRSRNNIFRQTDWSGGAGQNGPATTTNSKFSTSSNINFSTTTGSLYINL